MNTCSRWIPLAAIVAVTAAGGCAATPRFAQRGSGGSSATTSGGSKGDARPSTGGVLLTLEGTASYYADDFNGKRIIAQFWEPDLPLEERLAKASGPAGWPQLGRQARR